MNNFLKKVLAAVLAAAIALTPAVPAQAMTKKQVNSEIRTLKRQISKDKNNLPGAIKKDAEINSRYTEIHGYVYSIDPFVVFDTGLRKRLHFKTRDGLTINSTDGTSEVVTGLAQISDSTILVNGAEAYNATTVTYSDQEGVLQDRIESNQTRLKLLQNSKKEMLAIDGITLSKGQSSPLVTHFSYNTQAINKLTWKSSNSKVVSVSKNGVVTGKKKGSAVISAKLSVTGKTYKTVVNVIG